MTDMIELNDSALDATVGGRCLTLPTATINAQKTNNSSVVATCFSASAIGLGNVAGVSVGVEQVNG